MSVLDSFRQDSTRAHNEEPSKPLGAPSQEAESSNVILSDMLRLVAAVDTLDALISGAAELFKSPMHVLDASYKLLASSNYQNLGDRLFIETEQLGYMADEQLEDAIQKHDSNLISNRRSGYFVYDHGEIEYPMVVSYILDNNELVGYLGMLCVNERPTKELAEQVSLLAAVISKLFIKGVAVDGQEESALKKDLLINLIEEGNSASPEFVKNRAIGLGLDGFKGSFGLINISCHDTPLEIMASIQNVFPGGITFYYRHQVLIFVMRPDQDRFELTKYEEGRFQGLLEKLNLRACVSESFHTLGELRTFFYKGEDVLQICGAFARTDEFKKLKSEIIARAFLNKRIYCTKNIVFLLSIYRAAKDTGSTDLRRFIRRDVLAMYKSDCEHDTDLVNTLFVYLDSRQSFIHAAKRLYCHKNTVIYRIDRIREMYGLDFSDAGVVVDLYLSLALLAIFNRIECVGNNRYFWHPGSE